MGRRFRSKQTRQLVARIRAACPDAVIELTRRGHLRVTGPGGTTVIPSKPGDHRQAEVQTRAKLARYAGIHLSTALPGIG